MSFIFEMNQTVVNTDGKSGKVIGRSECLSGENQYLVEYVDSGESCWWHEGGLSSQTLTPE